MYIKLFLVNQLIGWPLVCVPLKPEYTHILLKCCIIYNMRDGYAKEINSKSMHQSVFEEMMCISNDVGTSLNVFSKKLRIFKDLQTFLMSLELTKVVQQSLQCLFF